MSKRKGKRKRREVEKGIGAHVNERCPDSGKVIYRTRRKALRVNGKQATRGGYWSADAYVCRFCGWWHLYTRPEENGR